MFIIIFVFNVFNYEIYFFSTYLSFFYLPLEKLHIVNWLHGSYEIQGIFKCRFDSS